MSEPAISVILVVPAAFDHVRTTLRHLGAQTAHDQLEIVLVVPERREDLDIEALTPFHGHRIVEVGPLRSNAHGLAEGVRAASAPIVAFGEDHCLPAPGWAEALLRAHEDGHAVVGPAFHLGNPGTAVSVVDFVMTYGPWIEPAERGERDHLPGHNSAYKRSLLIDREDDLERWLEAESVLHWDLRAHGHSLYLEPDAAVHHFNFSLPSALFEGAYYLARGMAGNRFPGAARRAIYALGTPLLPLIRYRRLSGDAERLAGEVGGLRVKAMLLAALVVSAVGEAVGYTFGAGPAAGKIAEYEYDRGRHMNAADRRRLREARFYP